MFKLLAIVLPLLALIGCARAPRCDRLLVGGIVHDGESARPLAIAVTNGRIAALVPAEEVGSRIPNAAEVVDLAGAHVYPGFTDAHGHLVGFGAALEEVDLTGTTSFSDVIERVRHTAAATPKGSWVRGRGWDQNLWPERTFPDHAALSAAVPDHPVLLGRIDGHAVLVNARAMAIAGVGTATPDPPGGRIVRSALGSPTGVLVDSAAKLVNAFVPADTDGDLERRVLAAGTALARLGITEIHNAGTSRQLLAVLRRLQAQRRLPLRVVVLLDGSDDALLAGELPHGVQVSPDGMLAVRGVKLFADGALGSRGAWLSAPYADDPANSGLRVERDARLREVIARTARARLAPCVHAIGDAAVHAVLDIFAAERQALAGLRPRIEHAQVVTPADVERFAELGVIASAQPVHCLSDMSWAPDRLGPDREAWAYRWRSLRNAGVVLAFGTDVPYDRPDPRLGLWAAVTRRPLEASGVPWQPQETLSFAAALTGATTAAAWAAGEELWRGRIAVSFAADFTVFDRDLGTGEAAILQARTVRTVVGGRDMFSEGLER